MLRLSDHLIRFQDLLDKVAQEIGEPIEADHDPIHDQVRYLTIVPV